MLTYLSEICTEHQINRINNSKLFGIDVEFNQDTKFYFYILLTDLQGKHGEIFSETNKLAENLKKEIPEIQDIVFLKLDKESKRINQIS